MAVSIWQSYYTDENAPHWISSTRATLDGKLPPSHFSPVALQVRVSPTTVTDATFRSEYDTQSNSLRSISANGGVAAGWAFVNAGWSVSRSRSTADRRDGDNGRRIT